MKITKSSVVGVMLSLSVVAACGRSDNNNNTPDAGPTGGSDSGSAATVLKTIQDVQSDSNAVNTPVQLHGVVVTAVDVFGDKTQAFWVEEPGGGPFSGVQVFVNSQTDILSKIAPGDVVDISGAIKTEFVLTTNGVVQDKSGRTTTELASPKGGMLTVTKTGTGTIPDAHVVDAAALDAMSMADRDAEYEKWEGVLIEVQNVRAQAYPHSFGKMPFPDDSYEVDVTQNLILESTQTKFNNIDGLTCFASITGVEDYFFDWLILPRAATDMVGGTGCAAVPSTVSTITALQATTPAGAIELDDVYVTGISNSKTSLWLATSPTATANQGAFVFQTSSTTTLDPAIVIGAKVKVIGTVSEFNDDTLGGSLTEIAPLRITITDPTPATLTPITGMTVAQLTDAVAGPTFESVLVTLDNVKITAIGAGPNGFIATATQNGATFSVGTDIVQLKATDEACYKTVTGFWTNLEAAGSTATTKPNALGFIIRDHGDIGTACN